MKALNILFLGGAKRVSLGKHILSYTQSIGLHSNIYSYELDPQVPIAAIGKVIIGLKWQDENILSHLGQVIDKYNINLILPFVDPAIEIASRLKKIHPQIFIPVSDYKICKIMFDKVMASNWFKENKILQPNVYETITRFPVILKPRKGSASKGIIICKCKQDIPKVDYSTYLIQDFIENATEYSVDCYVGETGEILSVVPRIRLATAGGEAVKSITKRDNELINSTKKILKAANFRGPITIQYLKDSNNCYYIMEVNPRFGGGVVTSIGAGSKIIEILIDEALGKSPEAVYNWRENTTMVRYFQEVFFYADNNLFRRDDML